MLFNSVEFIVFFVVVFILYWFVLQKNLKLQNMLLLAGSYFFYGWWDWRFLFLIILSSSVDYYLGSRIYNADKEKTRKRLLYFSLGVNLGFLGFFKYFNFFIDSLVHVLSQLNIDADIYVLNIILPVGISFYTFQTLSYTLDIYKKKMRPTNDILSFFTFVAFFPQLVAGPIERAKHLLPQFSKSRKFDYDIARRGGQLILLGFFKKIVIADSLAILVDAVYNNPDNYTGFPMIVATVFFAFQIYCDFSGYSDIAIGLANILGFDLMTNFRTPYFSKSLTEFWRRWHISLSTWFRDYVYIPLGGSRVKSYRVNINIFITFLLSGLWHGANWTFIIWGGIHGLFLIIEKYVLKATKKNYLLKSWLSIIYTFIIVCFAWIFFRSNNVADAFYIINHLFSDMSSWSNFTEMSLKFRGMGLTLSDLTSTLIFLFILISMETIMIFSKLKMYLEKQNIIRWSVYIFLLISIITKAAENEAGNFIYFQF